MSFTADSAFISDVAARHVGSLHRGGPPSLALLADLAAICEAAVLSETLIVSPFGRDSPELLQRLDFVVAPEVTMEEGPSDPDAPSLSIGLDDRDRLSSDKV